MDLHENSEKNLVTASFEFPGATKNDHQIEVHNCKVTILAETKNSTEKDDNGYAVRERRFGKYSRTLQLPQGVKVCHSNSGHLKKPLEIHNKYQNEEIASAMENGVLTITSPAMLHSWHPKKSRLRKLSTLLYSSVLYHLCYSALRINFI